MSTSRHCQILEAIAARFQAVPGADTVSTSESRVFSPGDGVVVRVTEGPTSAQPAPMDTCSLQHQLEVVIMIIVPVSPPQGTGEPPPSWRVLDPYRVEAHARMMGTADLRRVGGLALDTQLSGSNVLVEDQAMQLTLGYTVIHKTRQEDLTL